MADNHTKEQRSYDLSKIVSSKTKPELNAKTLNGCSGIFLSAARIMGTLDFADKKHKIVLFVAGCF